MSQSGNNELLSARIYHEVMLKEASIISGVSGNLLNNVLYIHDHSYCLSYSDLINIAKKLLHSNDKVQEIIDNLMKEGFIIPINENCFRSFHMDFLLRLSDLRLHPNASRMVLSSRFGVTFIPVFSQKSRVFLPKEKGPNLSKELYKALVSFIERENVVKLLSEALRRYFQERGSEGFDPYQASALAKALRERKAGYLIIAPTGSGKTEVFLTLGISFLLKDLINGRKGKMIIVYPRKMLEVDQMSRIIKLLKELNRLLNAELGFKLRIFLRDGDTSKIKEALKNEDVVDLRGIACGSSGKLLVEKVGGKYKVVCSENNEEYDFVIPTQCDDVKSADIIVTTWNTLMYRLVDIGKSNDIDVRDVLNTSVLILDEAHEYDSVQAAVMSYIISILREFIKEAGGELRCIVSTATLPDPLNYVATLLNLAKENITDLSFNTILKNLKQSPQHQRLVVTLFVQMLPRVSWITYLAEAIAAQLLLFKMYKSLGRKFLPQAIVFINNVREVNRARIVVENQLSLGSPLDNLCVRRYSCEGKDPQKDRNILSHYLLINKDLGERIRKIAKENKDATLYEDLGGLCSVVFSGVSLEERGKIYEKMLRGDLATLLATSSLELGMDYSSISIIFNVGMDKPESLIQRFGRGGRSLKTMLVTLAVQVMRNNPLDYRLFNMRQTLRSIISQDLGHRVVRIPKDNNAIKLRVLLNLALMLYVLGSGISGTKRIWSEEHLINLLEGLRGVIKDEKFVRLAEKCNLIIGSYREFPDLINFYIEKLQEFYLNKEYAKALELLENVPDKSTVNSLVNTCMRKVLEAVEATKKVYSVYSKSKSGLSYIKEPKIDIERLKKTVESIRESLESYRETFIEIHSVFEELQEEFFKIVNEDLRKEKVSKLQDALQHKVMKLNEISDTLEKNIRDLSDEIRGPRSLCNIFSSSPQYQNPCMQLMDTWERVEELQRVLQRDIISKLGKVIGEARHLRV